MPIAGMCFFHGNNSIPTGALECNGQAVSRTTYADLFAAIGTAWDTFDGQSAPAATHFRVPKNATSGNLPIYPSATTVGAKNASQNKSHGHSGSTSGGASATHRHYNRYGRDCSTRGNWGSSVTAWEAGTYTTSVTLNSTGAHTHSVSCNNEGAANEFKPESTVGKWCIWATV